MSNINLLGIDLAKDVFYLHGADEKGNPVLKKRLTRNRLEPQFREINLNNHLLIPYLLVIW
jgi:transposase